MTDRIDHAREQAGPAVILLHSSVAGAGQWRRTKAALGDRFHCIAPDLYGYGASPGWCGPGRQTLDDQVALIEAALPMEGSFSIVGHSFGGTVAMQLAARHPDRIDRLVLIEPNPFPLLAEAGRDAAFGEAKSLRAHIARAGIDGDWARAAEVFADYWTGLGSWAAMPSTRRDAFARALRPNLHEWDAVMEDATPLVRWRAKLPHKTTVISAQDTVRSIREIVALMEEACPHWQFIRLPEGGHMAPLTRPDAVNGRLAEILGAPRS
ncbi:alpha/beta hydrolase [Jannaschia seohaensis]|uniref:Haloalkane dehalogenase/2-hydroxymuconate-semialdehyde hydrolase/2-hydroxy-6-oxo-octa-2,4-dienoate hydrolase n=1 Tax=Jannaschia seohaensis TaxID=475081 RepID=A0A2Y9C5K0_9RHOB|nr:alpha/beta hydrolase [Jannaschia seohaensis]PWJ21043.1 haloalkane dehalogenase/2-hydroxymuconate-semialdehyde hydrolase/2-hydroxy-6-oxo-octa-2,4-dienoate hydrolase [Jannaschia seohaensis]SSA41453.1 haloalkane dehalogenase/2-hydroxymuconate-semialdehyde hydrolase/2-hydroxy-6-oxo-octa-2,4-dienoate hydrolase [Jannaschia seohaensis]